MKEGKKWGGGRKEEKLGGKESLFYWVTVLQDMTEQTKQWSWE